ncbi:DUF397 domain-containing protein [Actinomadura barringtoniae]|uniref:DUF397 domain-containing protein n=1 Tax=Actinomadura barringtoniae TaxID=1427535 RepID=A0A939T5V2_9ACTN|nr:DUF397 domain-containing protein [Actinomadura barringtoniae]MBO2454191.1 DUF397 domain-containing protein [Actinomadura barringtoniae]
MDAQQDLLRWRKARRSEGNGGACVEVASRKGTIVRDSKDPDGPRLNFSRASWRAFHEAVIAGELDLP